MELLFEIALVLGGTFGIYFGLKIKKKDLLNNYYDITHTGRDIIWIGLISIVLGILGILQIIPWEYK